MPGVRPTDAEVERRVDEVFDLLLQGITRRGILRFVANDRPEWQASSRTVDNYIAKATARLKELAAHDREVEFGRAVARLHNLYAKTTLRKDYRTALNVQKELSSLLDLTPAEKLEITGAGGGAISVDVLAERFDALLEATATRLAKAPPEEKGGNGKGGNGKRH